MLKISHIAFTSIDKEFKKELYTKIQLKYPDVKINNDDIFIEEDNETIAIMELIEAAQKPNKHQTIHYEVTDETKAKYTVNTKRDFDVAINLIKLINSLTNLTRKRYIVS